MQFSIDDRKFLGLAAIVAAILLRKPLVATLLPFLLAVALAAFLEPLVDRMQKRLNVPRTLISVGVLIGFVFAGGYLFLITATKVLSELVQMGGLLQKYQRVPVQFAAKMIDELNRLNELFDQGGLPQEVKDNLLRAAENITQAGVGLVTQSINFLLNTVSQVPSFILILVIALLATYFLVKDKEKIVESVLSLIPPAMRDGIRELQRRIVVDLVGFFQAQFILFFITTTVVSIGIVAIGIKYWMTLALLAGILDIIPVVGPGFLFVPWAVGAWTLGQPRLALQLLALFFVSFLIRQLFQAKILGDSIGVHPLTMLLALYAGIHFFGIQGVIVAPVLVIITKGVFQFMRRSSSPTAPAETPVGAGRDRIET